MDADTLRIILAVVGALAIAGLYLWERRRAEPAEDDALDEADRDGRKREPNLGALTEDGDEPGSGAAMQSLGATEKSSGSAGEPTQLELPHEPEQTEFKLGPPGAESSPPEFPPGPMILTLHIAATGEPFDGAALVHAAARFGLEPGEMEIFHCRLGEDGNRQTLFSMANMVKPGTFPFGAMAEFETPGVTLFAQLDGTHDDPGRVEEMLGTAHSLATELGGEIRDAARNRLTDEAEERLRERVMAFIGVRLGQSESA